MKIRKGINIIGAFLLVAAACIFPASSTRAASSLYDVTFKCATTDQSVTFSGEKFKIYQIEDENGEKKAGFADVAESEDEVEYASALKERADSSADMEVFKRFTTNTSGEGQAALGNGLYLLCGDEMVIDGYTYTPIPFLIRIDSRMESTLTSYVKYDTTEPTPEPGKDTGTGTENKTTVRTGDQSPVYL